MKLVKSPAIPAALPSTVIQATPVRQPTIVDPNEYRGGQVVDPKQFAAGYTVDPDTYEAQLEGGCCGRKSKRRGWREPSLLDDTLSTIDVGGRDVGPIQQIKRVTLPGSLRSGITGAGTGPIAKTLGRRPGSPMVEGPTRGDPTTIVCPAGLRLQCFSPTIVEIACIRAAILFANELVDRNCGLGGGFYHSTNYVMVCNGLWWSSVEGFLDADARCRGLYPSGMREGLTTSIGLATAIDRPVPYSAVECRDMGLDPPCEYSTLRGMMYGRAYLSTAAMLAAQWCRCVP